MKKHYFTKSAGAGAKCNHFKLGVRAHLNLDVPGACVQPKKRSQLTPCSILFVASNHQTFWQQYEKMLVSKSQKNMPICMLEIKSSAQIRPL